MPKIDSDTKNRILIAAEKVFHANGFKGTRTTMIAEEAGISRTMLHYYYSTKEALFQEVMNQTLNTVFSHIKRLIRENQSLEELIEHLIDVVADLFEAKPGLPSFIVNLLNEMPEMAAFVAASHQDTIPFELDALIAEAKLHGQVADDITGEDLILNIYGLCSIPYLGASYIRLKENRDDEQMKDFLQTRRLKIKALILRGLR
ncbi:MAG: TetR/AcrR family transcriptional regulator [Saprospiraceae bacterium]|nr:TetR/AcrR family transcriptional regulator [Saprospiraceae bacterium]